MEKMKMKGQCDLCGGTARVQCESDEAKLCFECDGKVHAANFLVARHSRTLLCRCCGGPTPWRASGPWLGPTVSLCNRCCIRRRSRSAEEGKRMEEEEEDEVDSGERNITEEEDEDEESAGDEEEEQVVPGTMETPPAVTESSSTSSRDEEEEGEDELTMGRKRKRKENVPDQDQPPCSSSSRPSHLPNRTTLVNPFDTAGDNEDSFRQTNYRKKSGIVPSDAGHLSSDLMSFGSGFPLI